MTPIGLLQQAADYDLKLGFEPPNTLTVEPAERCPKDFADTLQAYKPQLLGLLQIKGVTWIEVFSESLEETIFFCQDEATKAALEKAGAEPWSVYTRDELRVLVAQNRLAPLSPAELRKVHEIKRTFSGRITK